MDQDELVRQQIALGILELAESRGIHPLDAAAIISYETGGTFDPRKKGPVTQWGQHEGLIQFGQPQQEQYGVDWSDPVGSQLGANGAVGKYFDDTGVLPGMGILDLYSAVNAGGVGRYGASDANNGGAPGTVYDKVYGQMDGHIDNGRALLALAGFDTTGYDPLSGKGAPAKVPFASYGKFDPASLGGLSFGGGATPFSGGAMPSFAMGMAAPDAPATPEQALGSIFTSLGKGAGSAAQAPARPQVSSGNIVGQTQTDFTSILADLDAANQKTKSLRPMFG